MEGILEGIRVIDISQYVSGPRCTQILAEMGAYVIKVEPPIGETMRIQMMLMKDMDRTMSILNRNKKGITLNLNSESGKDLFKEFVKNVDIVVENSTPGVMKKLGLDYQILKEINPSLIYLAISGFGQTGPNSHRMAFDLIAQATGGIMHVNRQEDKVPGVFFGDLISGAYGTIGILLALIKRMKTGKGQMIDISMQDVMYMHNYRAMSKRAIEPVWDEIQISLGRNPNMVIQERKPVPFWNSFKTKDGYVAIVALTDGQWKRFMHVIGRPDLLDDERFSNMVTRIRNADDGVKIIEDWAKERTSDEIVKLLDENRIPCGPVMDMDTLNTDPHLKERDMLLTIDHPRLGEIGIPGIPIKLSEGVKGVDSAAPDLGQHTEEVLKEVLDYDEEKIKGLRKENAI